MLGAIVATGDMRALSADRIAQLRRVLADHADRVLLFGGVGEGGPDQVLLPPAASPLAAIALVLGRARDDHTIVAAADLKRPSSELIRYMIQVTGSFDAVAPERSDGSLQPLLAIYHPRCARRAAGLVAAGERDPARLLDSVHLRRISIEEIAKFGTPGELTARG